MALNPNKPAPASLLNPKLAATDRCVMCGMCLPHCPTYGKTRHEADSPRGRIALMQGLNTGQLAVDEHLLAHLDGCLACRACESVCPSGVPYGDLIDAVRETLAERRPQGPGARLGQQFIDSRGLRRVATRALRFYQVSGLQRLARNSGLLRAMGLARWEGYLSPARPHAVKGAGAGPTVALFTGCASEVLDRRTLADAVAVLAALGYRVDIPPHQGCCGAIDQHAGRVERARALMARNLAAFDAPYQAIIGTASGCSAVLADYGRHDETAAGEAFANRVVDVSQFVAEALATRVPALAALHARVAIHAPCSLTHALKAAAGPRRVLESIPGIELVDLPDNARCCGAAGSYMLSQPEMADSLREDKLVHLRALRPDILVTSNVGCALHLRAGIAAEGLEIEVLHPISLLARQMAALHEPADGTDRTASVPGGRDR